MLTTIITPILNPINRTVAIAISAINMSTIPSPTTTKTNNLGRGVVLGMALGPLFLELLFPAVFEVPDSEAGSGVGSGAGEWVVGVRLPLGGWSNGMIDGVIEVVLIVGIAIGFNMGIVSITSDIAATTIPPITITIIPIPLPTPHITPPHPHPSPIIPTIPFTIERHRPTTLPTPHHHPTLIPTLYLDLGEVG